MTQPITMDLLKRLIDEAVQAEIAKEVDIAVVDAKKRMESKIPQIVAGVVLRVAHQFNVRQMQDMVLIECRLEQKP